MSSMIEIQQQLRAITEDFHRQIIALTQELSELTVLETGVEKKKMNFSRLERLGKKRPIKNHPLKDVSINTRRRYLTFLCALAQTAPCYADDAWLFIQRIASSVEIGTLEDCAVNAMRLTETDIGIFADDMNNKSLKSVFVRDAMLVYLAMGGQCEKTQELLIQIIGLFDISESRVMQLIRDSTQIAEQGLDDYKDWLIGRAVHILNNSVEVMQTDPSANQFVKLLSAPPEKQSEGMDEEEIWFFGR